MKSWMIIAAGSIVATVGWAQIGDGNGVQNRGDRPNRGQGRQMMLEKFDSDGDGQISETEREAAWEQKREKQEQRRKKMLLRKFDDNLDGQLNAEEEARAEAFHQLILDRFDENDNGVIDQGEGRAVRETMQALYGKPGGRQGDQDRMKRGGGRDRMKRGGGQDRGQGGGFNRGQGDGGFGRGGR